MLSCVSLALPLIHSFCSSVQESVQEQRQTSAGKGACMMYARMLRVLVTERNIHQGDRPEPNSLSHVTCAQAFSCRRFEVPVLLADRNSFAHQPTIANQRVPQHFHSM